MRPTGSLMRTLPPGALSGHSLGECFTASSHLIPGWVWSQECVDVGN